MSPTVLRWKGYRLFFFSREEQRAHVHVHCADGEAKIWLEPKVEAAQNYGLSGSQLTEVLQLVKDRVDEIRGAWNEYFRR